MVLALCEKMLVPTRQHWRRHSLHSMDYFCGGRLGGRACRWVPLATILCMLSIKQSLKFDSIIQVGSG